MGAEQRDGIVYILHAEEFEHASYTEMIDRIKSLVKTYNYTEQICDDSQPAMIREFPNCKGFSFKDTALEATDNAAKQVAEKNIRISPQFEELIRQLRSVQRNEKGTADKKRLSFDLGDAFLMSIYELTGHRFYGFISRSRW